MVRSNGSICSIGRAGSTCKTWRCTPQQGPQLSEVLTSGSHHAGHLGIWSVHVGQRAFAQAMHLVSATTAIISRGLTS